tara:strand:+ start:92 stop:463 length:372 start_codon:yes stop_codon:yes gene_type:complete
MTKILAPISLGELVDKITILEIKTIRLTLENQHLARNELNALRETLDSLSIIISEDLINGLKHVNLDLWSIEDDIRKHEKSKDFGTSFIELARSVYKKNDERASIKRIINTKYDSEFIEVKSY